MMRDFRRAASMHCGAACSSSVPGIPGGSPPSPSCWSLKHLLKQHRPDTAGGKEPPKDPGMPSSHAQSLAFLSTFTASALAGQSSPTAGHSAAAAALVLGGLVLAGLRVACKDHTFAQVGVGFSLGTAVAWGWQQWGRLHVYVLAEELRWVAATVHGLAVLAAVGFAAVTLRGAGKDLKKLRKAVGMRD